MQRAYDGIKFETSYPDTSQTGGQLTFAHRIVFLSARAFLAHAVPGDYPRIVGGKRGHIGSLKLHLGTSLHKVYRATCRVMYSLNQGNLGPARG